jgi:hypothetical protein
LPAERESFGPPRPAPDGAEASFSDDLARRSNRRGFLERLGGAVIALAGAKAVTAAVLPDQAEAAYTNFCGHTYTTGNCVAPTGLPRIDRNGYPVRASDGVPVDDLGRPINSKGEPIGPNGQVLTDADGVPLPPAPRTQVCETTGADYGVNLSLDGSWYRCCGGTVRRIRDCCGVTDVRINGDAALVGYCYPGRHVFCVTYYETSMPC